MVILIELEESESQIISGFPEYITLTTNIPSNIFYTLDGTDPNLESEIFINRLYLPTDGLRRTLKVMAVSGDMVSSILEKTYYTDVSNLNKSRLLGKEGIRNLPSGENAVNHLSFDENGNPSQESHILFEDLDLIASTTNRIGEDISGNTTIDFINFGIKIVEEEDKLVSNLNDINFNPKSQYIIMDGSTLENLEGQVVRVINRPHNSMNSNSFVKNKVSSDQLVSSGLVRYMIDPRSGKISFYYHDSRENRWIKSTQKISGSSKNLSNTEAPPSSFVFRWIEDRYQTRIY